MQRGRQVAQRAERRSVIARYEEGKKIKIMVPLPGHPKHEPEGRVNLYYVDEVLVFSENIYPPASADYVHPSDALMATLALAIGATTGFDGIPAERPTHRISEDSKRYNAALRERNKGRPDFE